MFHTARLDSWADLHGTDFLSKLDRRNGTVTLAPSELNEFADWIKPKPKSNQTDDAESGARALTDSRASATDEDSSPAGGSSGLDDDDATRATDVASRTTVMPRDRSQMVEAAEVAQKKAAKKARAHRPAKEIQDAHATGPIDRTPAGHHRPTPMEQDDIRPSPTATGGGADGVACAAELRRSPTCFNLVGPAQLKCLRHCVKIWRCV